MDNEQNTRGNYYGRGRGSYGAERGGYGGRGGFKGDYQRPGPGNKPFQTNKFSEEEFVAVKIRGLPYQTRYDEISDFFRDYKYIDKSVILGVGQDGRKNGFASILFEDEQEARDAAQDMNQQHVGSRYVELSVISYGDYLRFNGQTGGSYGGFEQGQTVKLSRFVNENNKERCLVMRGCPYKIQVQEILNFFDGYGILKEEDIFIEEFNGKRTGSVLVIFENKDVAQDAKEKLNKKEIGQEARWVELLDCNDQFMIKICNLFQE